MSEITRILRVSGDEDYAALTFEEEIGIDKAKELIDKGEKIQGEGFFGEILEFGPVDPNFIEFIKKEVIDYDHGKHENIYLIP